MTTSDHYIATYTHGVQGLISQRRGSTTNWYAFDDLGSTRDLTNSSQTITDAYTYKAFGEIPAASGSTTNPFRYIGALNYYQDADSSLLMLGARYYDPQWGRFGTRDPARYEPNSYGYAGASPTSYKDPTGEFKGGYPCCPPGVRAQIDQALSWLKGKVGCVGSNGRNFEACLRNARFFCKKCKPWPELGNQAPCAFYHGTSRSITLCLNQLGNPGCPSLRCLLLHECSHSGKHFWPFMPPSTGQLYAWSCVKKCCEAGETGWSPDKLPSPLWCDGPLPIAVPAPVAPVVS